MKNLFSNRKVRKAHPSHQGVGGKDSISWRAMFYQYKENTARVELKLDTSTHKRATFKVDLRNMDIIEKQFWRRWYLSKCIKLFGTLTTHLLSCKFRAHVFRPCVVRKSRAMLSENSINRCTAQQ